MGEKSDKIKLSLELSPQVNARLEEMAEQAGVTKSELLRKAIALMDAAIAAKPQGQKLAFVDQATNAVTRDILGL